MRFERIDGRLIRLAAETSAVGMAVLFAALLAVTLRYHPSWALALAVPAALAAAYHLIRRLRAYGETRYFVYYLLFLYPLLAPGILTGVSPRHFIFYYAATAIPLFLPQIMPPQLPLRAASGIGLAIALIVGAGFAGYAAQTGEFPSKADLLAAYQTDVAEGVGFVTNFVDPVFLILIVAALLGLLSLAAVTRWSRLRAFPLPVRSQSWYALSGLPG